MLEGKNKVRGIEDIEERKRGGREVVDMGWGVGKRVEEGIDVGGDMVVYDLVIGGEVGGMIWRDGVMGIRSGILIKGIGG